MKSVFLFFILFLPFVSFAQTEHHPKVGLVLSGGGAKAGAHIGVIKVLEELNIPIDVVVGTSMGAVVGGLYAIGYSGNQIEEIITGLDWGSILLNTQNRDYLYYRRKRDDDIFLISEFVGFKDGRVKLPFGIVQGHKLYQSFKQYTIALEPIGSFDNLPIPYRSVATDLITGNKVVLSEGDLAKAMYASMAVPGIFTPVNHNGGLLIDGGVSNNIPIEVAKELGAERLIVVNIGAPMHDRAEIEDFQTVLDQISNIQINSNVSKSLGLLTDKDILISPDIRKVSTSDYAKLKSAIILGEEAAYKQKHQFIPLSKGRIVSHAPPKNDVFIKAVKVINHTSLCTDTYYHYLPKESRLYTPEEIDQYISRLYGLDMFETIKYNIHDEILYVTPIEKSWGPTYLQASVFLTSDFDGNGSYRIALGLTKTMLNQLAGELRVFGAVGSDPGAFIEWYQPISSNLAWFIDTIVSYQRKTFPLFIEEDEIARYRASIFRGTFSVGRNLREWGRIEAGYSRADGSNRVLIGWPTLIEQNFDIGFGYFRFEWDKWDNSFFPNSGAAGNIQYALFREGLGNDSCFDQLSMRAGGAKTFNRHTLLLAGQYEDTTKNRSALNSLFRLGGLFRLSGLSEDQLSGQQSALLVALYYYRFKEVTVIPNKPFPLYLGLSLETGNTWETSTSVFKHSFRKAGSVFVGADTIIGPFYFGYGFAENGHRALHLFMGRPIQ